MIRLLHFKFILFFILRKELFIFVAKNSFSSTMKIIISFSRNSIIRLFQFSCRLLSTGKPPKLRKFPIIFVHETDNASNDAAKKQLTLIIFHDNNSPLRDSSRFHRISCQFASNNARCSTPSRSMFKYRSNDIVATVYGSMSPDSRFPC